MKVIECGLRRVYLMLGRVYKIHFGDIVYVGSTIRELNDRWWWHRNSYKRWLNGCNRQCISIYPYFKEFCIENFKIELIKEYEILDRRHLEVFESLWIYKLKSVNKKVPIMFDFLVKEYQKNWYSCNIERILEDSKSYYNKNRDEINTKHKEYRLKNREEINEKARIKRLENRKEINEKRRKRYLEKKLEKN